MATKIEVVKDGVPLQEDIFTPGNLVKLKSRHEDDGGIMVLFVTDAQNDSKHFSGTAVISKENPSVGHHSKDYNKTLFEQFVGDIVLKGRV